MSLYIWKNRLSKLLDNPRAVIPFLKKRLYYNFVADRYLHYYKDFHYLSYQETIKYAIENNLSIVRFGDELFDMIQGIGLYYGNWRQKYDKNLARKMQQVISSKDKRLLICFNPEFILKTKQDFKAVGIPEQYQFWTNSKIFLKDYYHKDMVYGSALCFTPRYNKDIDFVQLGRYFKTKHIVILTSHVGRFSSISLGKTTDFIEAPGSDAWQSYEAIMKQVQSFLVTSKYPKEQVLILVSMGSAAKVFTYDMTMYGYQTWDTGQFFDLASKEIEKHFNGIS